MPKPDTAGVIAPPPLIALAALAIGLGLDRLVPAYVLTVLLSWHTRIVLAAILIAAGLALAGAAIWSFHKADTPPEPWHPTTALVTSGIFARMRNPMYVGGGLVMVGVAMLLASDWTLVMTIVAAFVLHRGVVLREERYLIAKFGAPYRRYLDAVPRYGWPF